MTIQDQLVALADDALAKYYDPGSDETLTRCLICGEWEGHTDLCPVPAIARWAKVDEPHCRVCDHRLEDGLCPQGCGQ